MFLFVGGIETGVTTINETKWAAWIMMGTLSPYIIAQAPRVLGLQTAGNLFILIAAVIAIASLLGYCLYQVSRSHIVKICASWRKLYNALVDQVQVYRSCLHSAITV